MIFESSSGVEIFLHPNINNTAGMRKNKIELLIFIIYWIKEFELSILGIGYNNFLYESTKLPQFCIFISNLLI
jgi:hypothetical protein